MGLQFNLGDGTFELKPALINMVQSQQFCGKPHEDANSHLQHFPGAMWHIHRQECCSRRHPSPPLPVLIVGKGEAMVLLQQGRVHKLGQVWQCIPQEVLLVRQDQCPTGEDLELPAIGWWDDSRSLRTSSGVHSHMSSSWDRGMAPHSRFLPWADRCSP